MKIYINGKLITEEEFLPGWTDYTKRVPLLKYDVTKFLREGHNVIGAIVGNGWACGGIGWGEWKKYYNIHTPCLYAKVYCKDDLGEFTNVNLNNWLYGYGPIRENDVYVGENQDWSDYTEDFSTVGFNCADWQPVKEYKKELVAEMNEMPKVLVKETLKGELIERVDNKYLYDFKQNFAGVVKVAVKTESQAIITVRHGENLDENVNFA